MFSRYGFCIVIASLLASAAAAGEDEQKPQVQVVRQGLVAVPAGAPTGDAKTGEKSQAERAAIEAELVAVVKVTEVVEPKDEAKEGKDGPQVVPNAVMLARRWQTVEKTISAEVVELLKGDKDAKSLKIIAQVRKVGNQEHLMMTVERQAGNATYKTTQSVPFTLAKDKESLVFLKLLREEKDEAGKVTGKIWALTAPLCDGAPKETVAAAKEALKKLAEWEKAPELSAEEATAIDALIKQLGSDSFETREKATKALTAKGEIARGKLREATKSSDAETGERATRILEAITPAYLKGQQASTDPSTGVQVIQGGAGVQIIQMEVQAGN